MKRSSSRGGGTVSAVGNITTSSSVTLNAKPP